MENLPKLSEVDPALLINIRAAIIHALNGTRPPSTRVMPSAPSKETTRAQAERHRRAQGAKPRVFKSRYVGVTQHRGRWLAQWGPHGATKGRVFPLTDEGELAAAWERARVLGLAEPEMRPIEQVAKPDGHATQPSEHGPSKQRLGGKRIA